MKKLITTLCFLITLSANASEVTKSKFIGYVNVYEGKAQLAQNLYLDLKGLNKSLNTELLENYNGLYKFELRGESVFLILQKENKEIEFGQIDSGLIDPSVDSRVQVKSISAVKTELLKFKKGIPVPRWTFDCGITGCGLDFDWKRARKLLVQIEAMDGSTLCLAKGYKLRPELKSGSCN